MLLVTGAFAGLWAAESASAVDLEGCTTIQEPGSYRLTRDVDAVTSPCIAIRAPDVELDGAGFDVSAAEELGTGIAVRAEGEGPSNVTVHSVQVDGFASANFEVEGASDVRLANVTAQGADAETAAGLLVADATGVAVEASRLEDNRVGLEVRRSSDVEVSATRARSNLEDGFRISGSEEVHLVASTASGNGAAGVNFTEVQRGSIERSSLTDNVVGALLDAGSPVRLVDTGLRSSRETAIETQALLELEGIGFEGWTLTGRLQAIQLHRTTVPDPVAAPHEALDLHLETTPTADDGFANVTADYPSEAVAAHEEPTMRWWSWDGDRWEHLAGYNVVEPAEDTVTVNATEAGVLAPVVETDATPPTTTDDAPEGWVNTSAEVALEASDEASGVAETRYATDDGDWQIYSEPITVTAEGVQEVSYRSVDVAGNEEPVQEATVRVDRTPPRTRASLDPSADGGTVDEPPTVTLAAEDALSGVDVTRYRLDGGPWTTYEAPIEEVGPGDHELAFRSWDRAGNRESPRSLSFEVADDGGGGGGGSKSPVEMLVQAESDETSDGERALVSLLNASRTDDTTIVLVHPGGDEEELASGPSATWDTGGYANGEYVLEARQEGANGSVTLASTPYLVEHARATVPDALLAVAAGAAIFVAGQSSGAVAGRVVRWLRYLVKTVRRALGIEYRERTKEHTSLRERIRREGGAVLLAAAVLATVSTLGGLPEWFLPSFLENLPLLGGAAVVFSLVWYGGDWVLARVTGQRPRYVLLGAGLVSLVVSTALFRSPFGTPGYVDKRDPGALERRDEETFLAHRTLADLGLVAAAGLVFLPSLVWGSYRFGEAGLFLVVMTLATGTLPVPPLPNHSVWRWNKVVAVATFGAGLGLYVAWQLAVLPDAGLLALGGLGLAAVVGFALRYADPGAETGSGEGGARA